MIIFGPNMIWFWWCFQLDKYENSGYSKLSFLHENIESAEFTLTRNKGAHSAFPDSLPCVRDVYQTQVPVYSFWKEALFCCCGFELVSYLFFRLLSKFEWSNQSCWDLKLDQGASLIFWTVTHTKEKQLDHIVLNNKPSSHYLTIFYEIFTFWYIVRRKTKLLQPSVSHHGYKICKRWPELWYSLFAYL